MSHGVASSRTASRLGRRNDRFTEGEASGPELDLPALDDAAVANKRGQTGAAYIGTADEAAAAARGNVVSQSTKAIWVLTVDGTSRTITRLARFDLKRSGQTAWVTSVSRQTVPCDA